MVHDDYLKILLQQMQRDLDEIKADVKSLQNTRSKFDGIMLVLSGLVSAVVSAVTIYFKVNH